MKPRWLLLAVSLICLLVLAPATALSQQLQLDLGCGTARIDGNVRPGEWANAATVPLYGQSSDEVVPSQLETGTAYFMNDGQYLYLGAMLGTPDDPDWDTYTEFEFEFVFAFEDEPGDDPDAWVDCAWEAESCDEPVDEGVLGGKRLVAPDDSWDEVWFEPWAPWPDAPSASCGPVAFTGVTYGADLRATALHMEMRVDLDTSPLNNVGPGDCFDLRWIWANVDYERQDPLAGGTVVGGWPIDRVDWEPYTGDCTILCLDPCEVEFVPEPGTMMLLGTGLAGLAGYATLRLRSGQALRWRARE